MSNVSIITCFSYLGNKRYNFNPKYVRSDLANIILYVKDAMKCPDHQIYVLTDLSPIRKIQKSISRDFFEETNKYIERLGYRHNISINNYSSPIAWLKDVCNVIEKQTKINIYSDIMKKLEPIITFKNSIEYASLFVNFIKISGSKLYHNSISKIFTDLRVSRVFFYFTGHGVRFMSTKGNIRIIKDIKLVIPDSNSTIDMYSRYDLRSLFEKLSSKIEVFVVFDCCHSENLLNCYNTFNAKGKRKEKDPRKATRYRARIFYLASSGQGQGCGFYEEGNICGSLFTYFLLSCLRKETTYSFDDLESKILNYRNTSGRKPQNLTFSYTGTTEKSIPRWVYKK